MLSLLLLIVLGIGIGIFATQNTQAATIVLGQYGFVDVPMYAIVLGAILFGVFISWLISLAGLLSNSLALRSKDGKLRNIEDHNHRLQERVRDLEVENAQLRGEEKHEEIHPEEARPLNPFVKFRQRFSH